MIGKLESDTLILFLSHVMCDVSQRLRSGFQSSEAANLIENRSCILFSHASAGAHPVSLRSTETGVVLYTGKIAFAAILNPLYSTDHKSVIFRSYPRFYPIEESSQGSGLYSLSC